MKYLNSTALGVVICSLIFSLIVGSAAGAVVYWKLSQDISRVEQEQRIQPVAQGYTPQTTQEERIIKVVQDVAPAVVSIIITKDVPIFEQSFGDPFEEFFGPNPFFQVPQVEQKGTEKKEVGGGSGFIVSGDGLVVTNKHVVLDEDAEYTVFTNDGKSYPAKVLARDPVQDLALLKIDQEEQVFPFVKIGNSDSIQIGQTVIAIGNALGEFRNTVSVGVISGLGRTITASGGADFTETIEDVIQTDTAINRGNSGGPLLNLAGEVIGVNTATVLDAQNIGFAVPANRVGRDLYQVAKLGKIAYPFLCIQYKLEPENGALVIDVVKGSAAEKAGIRKDDILLEFDGKRITAENSLGKIIQQYDYTSAKPLYNPGDTVKLKIRRGSEELILSAVLDERKE